MSIIMLTWASGGSYLPFYTIHVIRYNEREIGNYVLRPDAATGQKT